MDGGGASQVLSARGRGGVGVYVGGLAVGGGAVDVRTLRRRSLTCLPRAAEDLL